MPAYASMTSFPRKRESRGVEGWKITVLSHSRTSKRKPLYFSSVSPACLSGTSFLQPPAASSRFSTRWSGGSSDNAIGSIQHLRRDRKSQSFCNLQIDSELELRVHLHGNLRRVCPFENLVHQACRLPACFVIVRTIAGKCAALHPECSTGHCRDRLPDGGLQDETRNI